MDFNQYVGLPFKDKGRGPDGYDCWGLTCRVLKEAAGIDLPSYSEMYVTAADREALASLISGEMGPWVPVESGKEKPLDVVLMTEAGLPRHVGVVVTPGKVLHIFNARESRIESYHSIVLRRRIQGFFRHYALTH